jgi:hypothetical protein
MLLGLWIILLLLTLPATALGVAQAALGAALATAMALRAGGASRAFSRSARSVVGLLTRNGVVIGSAIATIRAALAADVTLSPGLVRIRVANEDGSDAEDVVAKIGAAPGFCVVSAERDSVLAHALNENSVDVTRVRAMLAKGTTP